MSKSSTFLTFLGAIGVVATAVMAVKATPKAERLLEEAKIEKGEELSKIETIKTAAPAYIPAIVVGVSTISCIFGANILNKRAQASLMSAYALLDSSYSEYKNKVGELYGKDADSIVKGEIAKSKKSCFEEADSEEDEQLFFDFNTLRYFNAPIEDVIQKVTLEGGNECYIISVPPSIDC